MCSEAKKEIENNKLAKQTLQVPEIFPNGPVIISPSHIGNITLYTSIATAMVRQFSALFRQCLFFIAYK